MDDIDREQGMADIEREFASVRRMTMDVVCYSGGREIYRGSGYNRVLQRADAEVWWLRVGHEKYVRLTGDCVMQTAEAP